MIAFAFALAPKRPLLVPQLSRDELERQWAERDRIWLEQRDWCRCSRPIPDRSYLSRVSCRRCSCWVPRRERARR